MRRDIKIKRLVPNAIVELKYTNSISVDRSKYITNTLVTLGGRGQYGYSIH